MENKSGSNKLTVKQVTEILTKMYNNAKIDNDKVALGAAIKAVNLQIGKTPKRRVYDDRYLFNCPTCDRPLKSNDIFCKCGQRLTWSKFYATK